MCCPQPGQLTTTWCKALAKSPLWCSVIIVVLALGFAAIMGAVAKSALTSSDVQGAPDLDTAVADLEAVLAGDGEACSTHNLALRRAVTGIVG